MAEPTRQSRRVLVGVAAGVAVLVVLALARGPVALLAAASLAVGSGALLGLPPLLRHDGIDWSWQPGRVEDVSPEPGIATLRRLLTQAKGDTTAAAELQDLVRALADDRTRGGPTGDGRLTAYLAGPSRRLDLDEVESVITELESLTPKETS